MLPASGTATPATRIRLTYKLGVSAFNSHAGLLAAINRLNDFLAENPDNVFIVSRASTPEAAGGLLIRDYIAAIDVRTNYNLPTLTWGELLAPMQRVPIGVFGAFGGIYAELVGSLIIDRGSVVQTGTAAQQSAAANEARRVQATQPSLSFAKGLTGVGIVIALAAVAIIVVKVKK